MPFCADSGAKRFHFARFLLYTAFIMVFGMNVSACIQAYSMTHFSKGKHRTPDPEKLSFMQKAKAVVFGVELPRPQNRKTPENFDLPFVTLRYKAQEQRFLEAWYVPCVSARALILLFHGYATQKDSLLEEARQFNKMGFAVMLVDFQGSGGSDGQKTSIGYHEASDVRASVDFARHRFPHQKIFGYGFSMGSVALMRAVAVHGIQLDGMILSCPFGSVLSSVKSRFEMMGRPSFPAAHLLVFWGGFLHGFNAFLHNSQKYAGAITIPVLLMQGARDRRVSLKQSNLIFESLAGVKTFRIFAKLGHSSYVLQEPALWKKSVSDFFHKNLH